MQKRGFSDQTISEFLVTRKNDKSRTVKTPKNSRGIDHKGLEIESERPGCRCVDSFFLDLSPPRLPRRHRLPHAGFIPSMYNLADVCEIAVDIVNSDRGMKQRSRAYPITNVLISQRMSMDNVTSILED